MPIPLPNIIKNFYNSENLDFEKICESIRNNQTIIDELVNYSVTNNKDAWVCAWILSKYSQKYNNSLSKYLSFYVENLNKIQKDGQLRQILIILQNIEIPDINIINIFDICILIFQNNKMQSSLRCNAFYLLLKICKKYNELFSEVNIIFELCKNDLSKGIRQSLVKEIERYNKKN